MRPLDCNREVSEACEILFDLRMEGEADDWLEGLQDTSHPALRLSILKLNLAEWNMSHG